jgi:hypothetical protein
MAQHDYIVANKSGAAFRADLNNGLAAIVSQNSGVAQPSTTYAYQWWADTATGLLKLRNAANNAWITIGTLADANLGLLSLAGGTLTGALLVDDSGTAALPAIAFDGDTNTGIFRPAADQLGIATNGVERVEFGTTEVVFNDDGADVDFRVEGDTNASLFKIDAGLDQVQVANLNGGPLAGTRNRILNGDMRIDQRNAGASVTPNNSYTFDRWQGQNSQTSKYTVQQTTTSASFFTKALQVTSSSAYSVVSGDYFFLNQPVEAFNTDDLAYGTASAKTTTLSFWVRSSLTGTFGGSIRNYATDRSYPFSYTITSANTYEYKTVTIPGDTSGTWVAGTNSVGLYLVFCIGAGSSFLSTANAWAAGNFVGPTGQTSVVGTSGATFYITGVQLETGSTATPFERRSYGQELALCQRYYQLAGNGCFGSVDGSSTTTIAFAEKFIIPMRTAPTVTWRTGGTAVFRFGGGDISNGGSSSLANLIATVNGVWSQQNGYAGLSANLPVYSRNSTGTGEFMACSAEL